MLFCFPEFSNAIFSESMRCYYLKKRERDVETSTEVICREVIENKMVVKTTEHTISDAEGVRTEKKTVVEEKSSRVESSIQGGIPHVAVRCKTDFITLANQKFKSVTATLELNRLIWV